MGSEIVEKTMEYPVANGDLIRITVPMVRKYLVSGKSERVTDQEIFYFMGVCKARRMNPFVKECYLVKYGTEPAAIITSIDYSRKTARKQKDCRGWKSGVIVQHKDATAPRYSNGLVLDGEKLIGGWFEAKPKGWKEPFKLEIPVAPYIKKKKDGTATSFWRPENQSVMIKKVVEAQGLRTLWGEELGGMYTADEMPEQKPPIDVTPKDKPIKDVNKDLYKPTKKAPQEPPTGGTSMSTAGRPIDHEKVRKIEAEKKKAHITIPAPETIPMEEPPPPTEPKGEPPPLGQGMNEQQLGELFTRQLQERGVIQPESLARCLRFVDYEVKESGATVKTVLFIAVNNADRYLQKILEWPEPTEPEKEPAQQPPPERTGTGNQAHNEPPEGVSLDGQPEWGESHPWYHKKWERMRAGNGTKTGFAVYYNENFVTLASAPASIREMVEEKFKRLYHKPLPNQEETPEQNGERDAAWEDIRVAEMEQEYSDRQKMENLAVILSGRNQDRWLAIKKLRGLEVFSIADLEDDDLKEMIDEFEGIDGQQNGTANGDW